jgi:hypothetical protein
MKDAKKLEVVPLDPDCCNSAADTNQSAAARDGFDRATGFEPGT